MRLLAAFRNLMCTSQTTDVQMRNIEQAARHLRRRPLRARVHGAQMILVMPGERY
jgi:hypothetical protein